MQRFPNSVIHFTYVLLLSVSFRHSDVPCLVEAYYNLTPRSFDRPIQPPPTKTTTTGDSTFNNNKFRQHVVAMKEQQQQNCLNPDQIFVPTSTPYSRRSFTFGSAIITTGGILSGLLSRPPSCMDTTAVWADTGAEVRGIGVNAFNGLAFQYRGSDFNGLSGSEIPNDEPSISYQEFVSKLKTGDVTFVEFYAPDGDVAYATLKPNNNSSQQQRIRIGEGYPIEQHDGYSSPAFAIRTVKNANVPYKFVVPALAQSK